MVIHNHHKHSPEWAHHRSSSYRDVTTEASPRFIAVRTRWGSLEGSTSPSRSRMKIISRCTGKEKGGLDAERERRGEKCYGQEKASAQAASAP